jgi:predicted glutamine amidotransferase
MEVKVNPQVRKLEGYVTIVLHNGKRLECHVSDALGSLVHPMSDEDLENKFKGLTSKVLSADATRQLLDQCWNITQLNDISTMLRFTKV